MSAIEVCFTGDLQRVRPQPGDVFVLTVPGQLTVDQAAQLRAGIAPLLGGAPLVILADGAALSVSNPETP